MVVPLPLSLSAMLIFDMFDIKLSAPPVFTPDLMPMTMCYMLAVVVSSITQSTRRRQRR